MHADQELGGPHDRRDTGTSSTLTAVATRHASTFRTFAVSQQIQRPAVHEERRELRGSVRYFLRHGHQQHEHVRLSSVSLCLSQSVVGPFSRLLPRVIAPSLSQRAHLYAPRYEKAVVAMAKQRVTLEVLSYHATAPAEEAVKLKVRRVTCLRPPDSRLLRREQ